MLGKEDTDRDDDKIVGRTNEVVDAIKFCERNEG